MSNPLKVYLAGAMSGLSFSECGMWRDQVEDILTNCGKRFEVFNPVENEVSGESVFSYGVSNAEKASMKIDLFNLRNSDIVICNDNYKSIGTAIEIGVALEHNIPILVLRDDPQSDIHPWIEEIALGVFTDQDELISFIIDKF